MPEGTWRNKGKQETSHVTVNGPVEMRRTAYSNKQCGSRAPWDQWLGIVDGRCRVGVRKMACRLSLSAAFVPAGEDLARTAPLTISHSALRDLVEREGGRAERAIRQGRPKRGSDGAYREFKIVSFRDPDKARRHAVGASGDHAALGRLMRREAGKLDIDAARQKYSVTDGAEWVARQ